MKTHLPVALRKALLAALVVVSASVYNRADAMTVSGAYQGNAINMPAFDVVTNPVDGVIHDNNKIQGKSVTINTDIGDADDAGNNEITAGAGGISMEGDIVSGNNALTAQGSSISVGNF